MATTPAPSAVFTAPKQPAKASASLAVESTPHLTIDLPSGPVTITVEDVDPETARQWLENLNTHNRADQDDRVTALARDMANGSWLFNGDTVRFAVGENGPFLADGQHRLKAIVRSETTQPCIVVRGLPAAAQEVIDTGKVRTFGDTLKLDGWSNENHIGAITRMLLLWDGRNTVVGLGGGGKGGGGGAKALTTKPELYAYLNEHKDEITDSLKVVHAMTATGMRFAAPSSKMAAAWVLLARLDAAAADLFIINYVVKGLDLTPTHPAKSLRDRLLRTDVYRPNPSTAFLLTLHAWKHWRNGTELDKLQAPRVWPKPDEFGLK